VQKTLTKQSGVDEAQVNFATGTARVDYRPGESTVDTLRTAVDRIGYQLEPVTPTQPAHGDEENERERRTWLRRVWLAWPLGLAVFVLTMVFGDLTWARWAAFAVTVPVQFVAG
jgi:cation transport ATPase